MSASDLDKWVVEQSAGSPSAFGFTLQAVGQEVLALCAQLLWDGWFVAHAHLVHDLEVVFILVPRPLHSGIQTQIIEEGLVCSWSINKAA